MLEFLNLKPEAFGLDISDLSLKIINLKKKGRFLSLASFGDFPVKSGIIKGGEIKDQKSLTENIKESLSNAKGEKLATKHIVCSLPEQKAFLQVIQLPKMPEEDLKSAVIYEAENYIPLPIEEVYLDFQIVAPLKNHLDHFDILIAALPRKTVDPYIACVKGAGLFPVAVEIESQSVSRSLIKDESVAAPVLLIDFSATKTSFIIFSGNSLRFTSSISVSSQGFTEAISKIIKVDLKEAEKLKIKYGLQGGKNQEAKKVFEALVPALTNLVEQVKKHLSFYHTHAFHEHLDSKTKRVEKILICGGGATLKGLCGFLSAQLKIEVELGNPWINILPKPLKEVPELSFEDSLGYTTALGLALRGIKKLS
ncbi:type IV pilus assembly protein PilM [Patescibacteria group bacterium]